MKKNDGSPALPTGTTLYRFNGVPVVAQASFWPAPILLTGLLAWVAGLCIRNSPGSSAWAWDCWPC